MADIMCPHCHKLIELEIKLVENKKEKKSVVRSEVTLEQELALVHNPPSWESIQETRKMVQELVQKSEIAKRASEKRTE